MAHVFGIGCLPIPGLVFLYFKQSWMKGFQIIPNPFWMILMVSQKIEYVFFLILIFNVYCYIGNSYAVTLFSENCNYSILNFVY